MASPVCRRRDRRAPDGARRPRVGLRQRGFGDKDVWAVSIGDRLNVRSRVALIKRGYKALRPDAVFAREDGVLGCALSGERDL